MKSAVMKSINKKVLWEVTPCSLVVYRRFRCASCDHPDYGDSNYGETSVNF
jgi:hypothetical protein